MSDKTQVAYYEAGKKQGRILAKREIYAKLRDNGLSGIVKMLEEARE